MLIREFVTFQGAACGHGTSHRNISCLRGNVEVNVQECFAHKKIGPNSQMSEVELIALDLNTETDCYIPCHGDCEVSEWSEWSHCHRNCQDNPTGTVGIADETGRQSNSTYGDIFRRRISNEVESDPEEVHVGRRVLSEESLGNSTVQLRRLPHVRVAPPRRELDLPSLGRRSRTR